jgi:hypothetical protein
MKDTGCFSGLIDGDDKKGVWNRSVANQIVLDARGEGKKG